MSHKVLSSAQMAHIQLPMYLTPQELAGMASGDYEGHRMRDVQDRMSAQDDAVSRGDLRVDEQYRPRSEGGSGYPTSTEYLKRLQQSVDEHGGIYEPIRVEGYGTPEATVRDGHHRSVVAIKTGRLVPVEHV